MGKQWYRQQIDRAFHNRINAGFAGDTEMVQYWIDRQRMWEQKMKEEETAKKRQYAVVQMQMA